MRLWRRLVSLVGVVAIVRPGAIFGGGGSIASAVMAAAVMLPQYNPPLKARPHRNPRRAASDSRPRRPGGGPRRPQPPTPPSV
ncbi:hypothetical protein BZA77DRAFT_66021 [Pyronema omphalodes]|nr:hypothetical protein BZA77DRAFT_66021 [Pyronema omphalodes]